MLNDLRLKALKTNPEPGKHGDRDGLYIRVDAKGAMRWQWRIRTVKGETIVSYGVYPEVGLAEARSRHKAARAQMRDGINPTEAKRAAKLVQAFQAANSFEAVTREWFATRKEEWAPSYAEKVIRRMEADMFPYIGAKPIEDITAPILLHCLRKIEARGAIETAHRALESCGQVMRYAVATGRMSSDTSRDLKGALRKPMVKHMAAVTDLDELGALLRAIYGYAGTPVVRTALQLAPMLLLRPGELRFARWEEIDLEAATWTIPPERMKRQRAGKLHGDPHIAYSGAT